MQRIAVTLQLGLGLLAASSTVFADPVGIYTYHGDNMRTGWNSRETQLTPATVTANGFGKLWTHTVDGQVYSQPLLAPGVNMGTAGTRNLVFVVTEHNSVYAFDADAGGDPLWQV